MDAQDIRVKEASVLLAFGLYEKAAIKLEEVLAVAPDHAEARALLRLCRPGDPALIPGLVRDAEELAERGEARDASRILRVVASDLGHLGRRDQRWKVLERIWYLVPDADIALELAERSLSQGDAPAALAVLLPAYKNSHDDVNVVAAVARCFVALGQTEKAASCFAEAARLADAAGDPGRASELRERAAAPR